MPRELDFTGESGTIYRYHVHEDERTPSPAGGNYLYVRMEGPEAVVVFAGETESLYRGMHGEWAAARDRHGADTIFIRLNVTGEVRRAELADLLARYRPALNAEPSGDQKQEHSGDRDWKGGASSHDPARP